jgi:hypothetical protein
MMGRMMGWMMTDDRTDGWKGRPDTIASGQNQGYYISIDIYRKKMKIDKIRKETD